MRRTNWPFIFESEKKEKAQRIGKKAARAGTVSAFLPSIGKSGNHPEKLGRLFPLFPFELKKAAHLGGKRGLKKLVQRLFFAAFCRFCPKQGRAGPAIFNLLPGKSDRATAAAQRATGLSKIAKNQPIMQFLDSYNAPDYRYLDFLRQEEQMRYLQRERFLFDEGYADRNWFDHFDGPVPIRRGYYGRGGYRGGNPHTFFYMFLFAVAVGFLLAFNFQKDGGRNDRAGYSLNGPSECTCCKK